MVSGPQSINQIQFLHISLYFPSQNSISLSGPQSYADFPIFLYFSVFLCFVCFFVFYFVCFFVFCFLFFILFYIFYFVFFKFWSMYINSLLTPGLFCKRSRAELRGAGVANPKIAKAERERRLANLWIERT